jgi:hypothetical protein
VVTVSGQVTSSTTSLGLQGTVVQFFDLNANADGPAAEATTDASGNYIANVPAGSYGVLTRNFDGYINEAYDDVPCSATCDLGSITPVEVTSGAITGIDFVLDPGGRMAGTVTDAGTGLPIAGVRVHFFDDSGQLPFASGLTDASGQYLSDGGTATGSVFAVTENTLGYQEELYNNIKCLDCDVTTGTPISVTIGMTTGGLDFALDAGGRVGGTVSNASLDPLANVRVRFFNQAGNSVGDARTDGSGNFLSPGLPAGTYFAVTENELGLVDKLYDDILCPNSSCNPTNGTPIAVTVPNTTGGIDFVLPGGGTITGTITAAVGGAPIENVGVQVFDASGVMTATFSTNASGLYTAPGLPAGTYFLRTSNSLGFINELYDDIPCPGFGCSVTSGTAVVVAAGAVTPGKDFALVSGGRISGTLTNAAGGAPIANASVQIFNQTGTSLDFVNTNGVGQYLSTGLPTGTYFARTSNSLGFRNELYDDIPCVPFCTPTSGTPISVTAGATTPNIDFALLSGGSISGSVTVAGSGTPLASISVHVHTSTGAFATNAFTDGSGNYTVTGLSPGTYYAKTAVTGGQYYLDELYQEMSCAPACSVTTGTPLTVTAGNTVTGVNFTLTPGGGAVSGTVTDAATANPIGNATVRIHSSGGTFLKSLLTSINGQYSIGSLPAGTYFARTAVTSPLNYLDELYDDLPCFPGCTVTNGTPIVITDGATHTGVDFALRSNFVRNSRFDDGTTHWQFFATPDLSYIVQSVVNGVLEYYRVPPPAGTSNQAVAFQETTVAVGASTPLLAQFDLGNSSSVRKRVSVLVLDSNFSDLAVCTFFLAPNAPLRTYRMQTHTTQAWANAAIYFYAATPGSNGGAYQLDNVSLQTAPLQSATRTDCVDPTTPVAPGGADGPSLLGNGGFDTGTPEPWITFGTITSQVSGGVFEFIRPNGTPPAGVVLQPTSQAMTAQQIMTATFQLGNSSSVRKRVTLILGDSDFSDLTACTFYIPPGQPLANYMVRTYATQAWVNATFSLYAATIGPESWIRFDNATLAQTPGAAIQGTECLEPGSARAVVATAAAAGIGAVAPVARDARVERTPPNGTAREREVAVLEAASAAAIAGADRSVAHRRADPIDLTSSASARLTFQSWLSSTGGSQAEVQVSVDGLHWITAGLVRPSDTWDLVEVDLSGFAGQIIEVRFVLDSTAAVEGAPPDVWRLADPRVVIDRPVPAATTRRDH